MTAEQIEESADVARLNKIWMADIEAMKQ